MNKSGLEIFSHFFNTPRIQMLGEADQRRYMMLTCFQFLGGEGWCHDEVAFQMRISREELELTKDVLIDAGLIDE